MNHTTDFIRAVFSPRLFRRMWQGAALALVLILAFLIIVNELTDGEWVLLPILTVSVGGACGGAVFHLAHLLAAHYGWNRTVVNIACAVVYAAGLWMSLIGALSVVGLWD